MKNLAPALATALGLLWAGPALAQPSSGAENRNSPAGLRCSALGELEEVEQVAAIQFLAGYSSGERDAMTFATVGVTDELGAGTPAEGGDSAAPAEGQQAEAPETTGSTGAVPSGGPPVAILPTIPIEAIIATCAQSPDSRIVDIIVAQGAPDSQ
jgi:hypothetical protein